MKKILVSFSLLLLIGCSNTNRECKKALDVLQLRAMSISVLQNRLSSCDNSMQYPPLLKNLAGITIISGLVIDRGNEDLILIGTVDSTLPPINLDNFVVALRNMQNEYADVSGDTIYYEFPGCSIDPEPKVLQGLQDIMGAYSMGDDTKDEQSFIALWEQKCRALQKVRVMGVPFDSDFARIMVNADYDLKQITNGLDNLEIEGFCDLSKMTIESMLANYESERSFRESTMVLNRFWFSPGDITICKDENIWTIGSCPVQLLTEEELVTKKGTIQGKGRPNDLSEQFAQQFTHKYSEIAKARPVFKELENLFRIVAIAKIVTNGNFPAFASNILNSLTEEYRTTKLEIEEKLPGVPGIIKTEYESDSHQLFIILPSCGGVSIEINETKFATKTDGELKKTHESVVMQRPKESGTLFWDINKHARK